ncbi:MAG TPA: protein kinase [Verrucomicrobiae bacterium]
MSEDASSPGTPSGPLAPGQYHGQGRFELVRKLGEGGMGQVWLAWDQRLNDSVALKFLPPEIRNDASSLDDMRRETLKSRKLSHPHIVRIHDLYESPGEPPFISMEFVDGDNLVTLRIHHPERCFTWEHLKPLVKQLCDALEYAHSEGVIHRDLKPGNMMVDRKGRLKLADFGIAATISESASRISVKHPNAGTLAYMSPQHLRGDPPKATDDIYALGATLYELLTSTPPYCRGDIIHQIESVPAKPLEDRLWELSIENPVPPDVSALILACLSKDPAQRPQSARAVAEWIGLGGTTAGQPRTLLEHTSARAGEVIEAEALSATTTAVPKPKRTALYTVISIVALLTILAGVWFAKQKSPPVEANKPVATEPVDTNDVSEPALEELKTVAGANIGSGRIDPAFRPGTGANDWIQSAALQPDGKIIIAGRFTQFNGKPRKYIARLLADGSVDESFHPGTGPDKDISQVILQPDGKLLIAGPFDRFNNLSRSGVARLNADGSLDMSFDPGTGGNKAGRRVLLQADGKIILTGFFNKFNGTSRNYLVRLNTDGSVDPDFNATGGPNDSVLSLCQMPDGRIWIGGEFTKVSGKESRHLALLGTNGALAEVSQAEGPVMELLALPDGMVMAGGGFNRIIGADRNNLARIKQPNALDRAHKLGSGFDGVVRCMTLLPDGGLLIGGEFNRVDTQARRGIARMNANGSINETMDAKLGGTGTVRAIALQPDGGVIVAGDFASSDGTNTTRITRILGASHAPGKITRSVGGSFPATSGWRDTGVDMQKGSIYEIVVTGEVQLSDGSFLNPDGQMLRPYKSDLTNQGKRGFDVAFPPGCLIGQIGDQKLTFFVGRHLRLIAPASGRLKLRTNANPAVPLRSNGQFAVWIRELDDLPFTDPDGRFEVSAKIDTADDLHLKPGALHWVHTGGGSLPGRRAGSNVPTLINEISWWPEWKGNTSAPLPFSDLMRDKKTMTVVVKMISRGQITVTQSDQALTVVRFDDSGNTAQTMRAIIGPSN